MSLKTNSLYHYSSLPLDVLKTKRLSGLSKEEIISAENKSKSLGLEAPYIDHISFFFDPIPSKLLPTIFNQGHGFWFKGNKIYEHVIDPNQFEDDVLYRVVESRRKTEFMDNFVLEHNWITDDPVLLKKYLKELTLLQTRWKELGRSKRDLINQIRLNKGGLDAAFRSARLREDFSENSAKYAANVPHLMLYPKAGTAVVSEINSLTIGDDARKKFVLVKPEVPSSTW